MTLSTRPSALLRRVVILALVGGLSALAAGQAPLAHAQTTGPGTTLPQATTFSLTQHKQVRLLLSAYHDLPPKKNFEGISPKVQDLLNEVATAPNVFVMHKVRAIEALGMYWQDQRAFALQGQLLGNTKTKNSTKHRLIMMTTAHFGAQGLVHLNGFMGHKDVQMRMSAAYAAMALPKDSTARAMLTARLKTETYAPLLNKIRLHLGTLK